MTSANLLVVLIVGIIVGALTGLAVGLTPNPLHLSVLAGFVAVVVAGIARNFVFSNEFRTPIAVILYAAIASLAGSALGLEVAQLSGLGASAVWIGALAGLFAAILEAMLMLTYHTEPGQPPLPRRRA